MLEKKLLCSLEESGQSTVSALLNTAICVLGRRGEVAAYKRALGSLVNQMLAVTGCARSDDTRQWIEKSPMDSLFDIDHLDQQLSWNSGGRKWVWRSSDPVVYILLTPNGINVAESILSTEGWSHEQIVIEH